MQISDLQGLLKQAGLYSGAIDGIAGAKTAAGVAQVTRGYSRAILADARRRHVAAAQILLNVQGFEAGVVDGYEGHNTRNALAAWRHKQRTGKTLKVSRPATKGYTGGASLPTQSNVGRVYGQPGPEIKSRLVTKALPFPLRIDWNLGQKATRVTLHRAVIDRYIKALIATRDRYGMGRMQGLGIDRFAGSYNHRKMRGGSRWSMHAYGIAVDHYAAPNGLRTRCPEALFCGPEYRGFLDIMESHGMLPAIRLWGADAMHFQAARMG